MKDGVNQANVDPDLYCCVAASVLFAAKPTAKTKVAIQRAYANLADCLQLSPEQILNCFNPKIPEDKQNELIREIAMQAKLAAEQGKLDLDACTPESLFPGFSKGWRGTEGTLWQPAHELLHTVVGMAQAA